VHWCLCCRLNVIAVVLTSNRSASFEAALLGTNRGCNALSGSFTFYASLRQAFGKSQPLCGC
jgi:hypothetical protein